MIGKVIIPEGDLQRPEMSSPAIISFSALVNEFTQVMGPIPYGALTLRQGFPSQAVVSVIGPVDTPVGKICFSPTPVNNNRLISSVFQNEVFTEPFVMAYWDCFEKDIPRSQVWSLATP